MRQNHFKQESTLFRSSDIDEITERFGEMLWPHRMQVKRTTNIDSYVSGFSTPNMSIFCLNYGADVAIDAGDMEDIFLLQHKLSGTGTFKNGSKTLKTFAGTTTIASPSQSTSVEMDSCSVHVVLKLNRHILVSCLQEILQQTVQIPIIFDSQVSSDKGLSLMWKRKLEYFWDQYQMLKSVEGLDFDSIMTQSAIELLLFTQPHNYSKYLVNDTKVCAPIYVRKAQEYIECNISNKITIAELSNLTGVTSRTLQSGFKRYLGQLPTDYIQRVRMEKIHNELLKAELNESVTDILIRNSVYDPGRFSGKYKMKYGCLPSYTLKYKTL